MQKPRHPGMTIVRLRVPVLTMILAATAIPIAVHPLQHGEVVLFSADTSDIVANIAGFIPVGIVLAALGPVQAVIAAALLSMFAEASQLVMLYRVPSLTDVATNVLGAILGVVVAVRYNVNPQFKATPRIGVGAAALCVLLISGVWIMSGNWPGDPRTSTPGARTLEAHWTFDESGGLVALDSSGHGLNGKYHDAPKWVAGPAGTAVKLDGAADYIDFGEPAALRLTSSVTISAWIRPTVFPRDDAAIVSSRYRDVGLQLDTTIDTGPRTIGFKLTTDCGATMARYGKTTLVLGAWYYVSGVYDAKARTMHVYLNGQPDDGLLLGPVTNVQKSSRSNVYVGRRSDSDQDNFVGDIADVRIYSLPLTQAGIAADMRGSAPRLAPQGAADGDHDGTPSGPERQPEACSAAPDPGDERIPGVAATLGVLAAIACVRLLPSGGPLGCLIAGLVAGLLFVSATPSTLSVLSRWMMLLLALAGAASVAFTMRTRS